MITTGKFRMYGQLEDQAATGDIQAFVYRNGEVVPASQAGNAPDTGIHTAPEKNYGQMQELANKIADVQDFVYHGGEIVPASQAESTPDPGIHTAAEKNYC